MKILLETIYITGTNGISATSEIIDYPNCSPNNRVNILAKYDAICQTSDKSALFTTIRQYTILP